MRTTVLRRARRAAFALLGLTLADCGRPALTVPAAPATGVRLRQSVNQYEVIGTSISELKASIHTRARLQEDRTGFAGYTRWTLNWSYAGSTMRARGCTPTGVSVNLELAVRYPAWVDSARASPAMLEEWRRYLAALKEHEANHAAIAIKGANRLARELRNLVAPGCGLLQLEARRRATEIMSAIREENQLYDERTRHGATEGAGLTDGA